jgi:hypothetical protein
VRAIGLVERLVGGVHLALARRHRGLGFLQQRLGGGDGVGLAALAVWR